MSDTKSHLIVHVVFGTKDRMPTIPRVDRRGLFAYMRGIVVRQRCGLLAIGGVEDHVHLLMRVRPDTSVSALIQRIKGSSSRWLSRRLGTTRWFGWQSGFGAFSVSPRHVDAVRRYVLDQDLRHASASLRDATPHRPGLQPR